MASTESAIGGGGLAGRIQRLAYAASSAVGAGSAGTAGNELDFRAIASVGLAALIGLPLLLIVSLALEAPFAAPAAIACGYVAAAAALYGRWRRSAALISSIVIVALTAIAPLFLMHDGIAISPATILALLLAPLFLAAPALVRFLLSRAGGGARALINNPPPTTIFFAADKSEENIASEKSPELSLVEIDRTPAGGAASFHSDVGDAVDFAARRLGPAARDKNVTVSCDVGKALAAACDRQTLRRIACLIAASAIAASPSGGSIRLTARRLRGAILLRATSAEDATALAESSSGDLATARALVEDSGGTLLVEQAHEQLCVSVRLDLARLKMANENGESGVRRVAS